MNKSLVTVRYVRSENVDRFSDEARRTNIYLGIFYSSHKDICFVRFIEQEDFHSDVLTQEETCPNTGKMVEPVFFKCTHSTLSELPELPSSISAFEINYSRLSSRYVSYHNMAYPNLQIPSGLLIGGIVKQGIRSSKDLFYICERYPIIMKD